MRVSAGLWGRSCDSGIEELSTIVDNSRSTRLAVSSWYARLSACPNFSLAHPLQLAYPNAAADALPLLVGAEYATLRDDIAAHGLHMPVVLTPDGMLLDGRNRARACEELGITPATTVYEGEPVAYVVSLNIARRHLNENQRGMVARKLANMRHGGDRKSEEIKRSIDLLIPEISITQAATMLNVSPSTVKRAMAVGKAAEAGLIPEQRDHVSRV